MIAGLAAGDSRLRGLRPFDPLRDLPPTAELIELAFGDLLDSSSREMLHEMRTLSWLLGPLFSLLNATGSPLANFYSGFVWVEQGKVVGNVTVHRHYKGRTGWFISNLAVHPDFRRQGIASQLVAAAIEFAKGKGAQRVSLEVRAENNAARVLYRLLGFTEVDSVTKMRMDRPPESTALPLPRAEIRRVQGGEVHTLLGLVEEALSAEAREIMPSAQSDYRASPSRRFISFLGDLLRGSTTMHLAAYRDGEIAALLTLRTGAFLVAHSLSLMVHPRHRGQAEDALLAHALYALESRRWQPILAEIHPTYDLAVEALERHGFVELETMELFTLDLRGL
jgi:ribosomal protein S18 acetylase RimI-like enzyme